MSAKLPDNESLSTRESVLLIDSSARAREWLELMLSGQFEVFAAANAADGIAAFEERRPSCVLVDDALPEMRDLALLKRLVNANGIVVVTSEAGSPQREREVIICGAQDYAIKRRVNRDAAERIVLRAVDRGRLIAKTRGALSALRESERVFRDIANRITEGLWVRTADGTRCIYLSPTFEKIWGRSIDEMNQIEWRETIHPDDRQAAFERYLQAREEKREFRHEYRVVRPDGSIRQVVNHAFPVLNEHGELVRQTGIARDVTDERRLEHELRIAQKLESVGQLSAGIAHEINTPSQYVGDNISFLGEAIQHTTPVLGAFRDLLNASADAGVPPEILDPFRAIANEADLDYFLEETPEALSQCQYGIEQIRTIVRAMKEFSHVSAEKAQVDVNRTIESTVVVARNEWKYVAEVQTDLETALPEISCVRSAISQVILNLVMNAAEAIEALPQRMEKGTISIKTANTPDGVVITVSDTGTGIPEEIRERIFDPFFTTKEVGKGTGQGLAFVYSVVTEQHGGSITVESEPGKGASFTVTLPRDESEQANKEAAA